MKTEKVTITVTSKRGIKLLKEIQESKAAFIEHVKKTGSSANFTKKVQLFKYL